MKKVLSNNINIKARELCELPAAFSYSPSWLPASQVLQCAVKQGDGDNGKP